MGIQDPLPSADWTNIQATRAFSVLSILFGAAGFALGVLSIFKVLQRSCPCHRPHTLLLCRCWHDVEPAVTSTSKRAVAA